MYRRVNIYDLDGVLVDTSHRYRTRNGVTDMEYWLAHHTPEFMKHDRLLPMVKQYREDCLDPEVYTIICSVRTMHEYDLEYILAYLGAPDKILLVGEKEPPYTADYVLKLRALNFLMNLKQFKKVPKRLFEDNFRTIAAFNETYHWDFIYIQSNQGMRP